MSFPEVFSMCLIFLVHTPFMKKSALHCFAPGMYMPQHCCRYDCWHMVSGWKQEISFHHMKLFLFLTLCHSQTFLSSPSSQHVGLLSPLFSSKHLHQIGSTLSLFTLLITYNSSNSYLSRTEVVITSITGVCPHDTLQTLCTYNTLLDFNTITDSVIHVQVSGFYKEYQNKVYNL